MKRYYVCKMIEQPEGEFYPAIHVVVDPQTGLRAFTYTAAVPELPQGASCLVLAAGKDHRLAANVQGIDPLPDYALDVKVSSMHVPTKMAALARLQAHGVNVSALSNADGYRDLIRATGRTFDPGFHEDKFDVSDD